MCVGVVKTWVVLPSVPQCFPCRNTSVSQRAAAKPLCLLQQEQAEQHGGGSTPQAPQAPHPEPTPAGCQQLRGCSQTGAGALQDSGQSHPPSSPSVSREERYVFGSSLPFCTMWCFQKRCLPPTRL